jgi:hypothetical protein
MQGGQIGMTPRLDFLLQNTPDGEVQQVQAQQIWRQICRGPEFCHVFSQEVLGGPDCVGQRQILLEDIVVIQKCSPDPVDYMLPQKVLINIGIDLTLSPMPTKTIGNSGNCCPPFQAPSAFSHREVCQVAAVWHE